MVDEVKTVHLCVPVLKRYDLLRQLITSAVNSDPPITNIYIIDNGRNHSNLRAAITGYQRFTHVFEPWFPLGLAASWNWFLRNVPEERLIVNDDIVLGPQAAQQIVDTPGHFVSGLGGSNAFSCFLIRDECIARIGFFDAEISPGYAYFEDIDYAVRMGLENIAIMSVHCDIRHGQSQTLKVFNPVEMAEHHRKFKIAADNFVAKWGCTGQLGTAYVLQHLAKQEKR